MRQSLQVNAAVEPCAIEATAYLSAIFATDASPGLVSVGEELLQHGSEDLGGHVVRLTFQGAPLRIRDALRDRLRR